MSNFWSVNDGSCQDGDVDFTCVFAIGIQSSGGSIPDRSFPREDRNIPGPCAVPVYLFTVMMGDRRSNDICIYMQYLWMELCLRYGSSSTPLVQSETSCVCAMKILLSLLFCLCAFGMSRSLSTTSIPQSKEEELSRVGYG